MDAKNQKYATQSLNLNSIARSTSGIVFLPKGAQEVFIDVLELKIVFPHFVSENREPRECLSDCLEVLH